MNLSHEQLQYVATMFNPGAGKIAICFSGQVRTWRKCVDTWIHILEHEGSRDNIDVFCHFWDFNSVPNSVPGADTRLVPVQPAEIQEILDILKPKRYLVESYREFPIASKTQAITHGPFVSQFYGVMKAADLKKQYEIQNDLQYKAVVRARYDAYYTHNMTEFYRNIHAMTMHGFHMGWTATEFKGRMGDIFWIADSDTYDIIADYYLNLGYIDKKWFISPDQTSFTPEFVFYHYLKKNNVRLQNNHWDVKLFRQSAELSFAKKEGGFEIW